MRAMLASCAASGSVLWDGACSGWMALTTRSRSGLGLGNLRLGIGPDDLFRLRPRVYLVWVALLVVPLDTSRSFGTVCEVFDLGDASRGPSRTRAMRRTQKPVWIPAFVFRVPRCFSCCPVFGVFRYNRRLGLLFGLAGFRGFLFGVSYNGRRTEVLL